MSTMNMWTRIFNALFHAYLKVRLVGTHSLQSSSGPLPAPAPLFSKGVKSSSGSSETSRSEAVSSTTGSSGVYAGKLSSQTPARSAARSGELRPGSARGEGIKGRSSQGFDFGERRVRALRWNTQYKYGSRSDEGPHFQGLGLQATCCKEVVQQSL
jgi:hypothetical protein